MVRSLCVAGRTIGAPARCFVIAEAGVNHNGDVSLAHHLIDAAADAGADAVKFQTFDPSLVAAASAGKARYQEDRARPGEGQRELLGRLVMPRQAYVALTRHAAGRGVLFLSTPFDEPSVDFLDTLGVPAFKVASGEIVNHPLLVHIARKRKPVLLSTGMSTLAEVRAAMAVLKAAGADAVALFHAVTAYPAPPGDCNLAAIATLRGAFQVPVGWSDHTEGLPIAWASVALGAELLEKHLTTDRSLEGPDHAASLEPGEFRALVAGIRAIEAAFGDGVKQPRGEEVSHLAIVRKSLHAAVDLEAGRVLAPQDVVALRPATGLPPSALGHLIGRKLRVARAAGEPLMESDVE